MTILWSSTRISEHTQKEIVASWDKVFDLQRYNPDWDTPMGRKRIQATLWEIRMEQVKKVEFFLAKKLSGIMLP